MDRPGEVGQVEAIGAERPGVPPGQPGLEHVADGGDRGEGARFGRQRDQVVGHACTRDRVAGSVCR